MLEGLEGRVIVVGGGTGRVGRGAVTALLAGGARVIVPTRREEQAERFYLEADPETVPRLRTAVGSFDDPAMPNRIAAVARREFGGVDHLVSAIGSGPLGALVKLDAQAVQRAVEDNVSAPGRFVLGMLRHLNGPAPVKRVVVITPAPGHEREGQPDAWSLARTSLEGLVALLRQSASPGLEVHALRAPQLADPDEDAWAIGVAAAGLLAGGAAQAVLELQAPGT